MRSFLEYKEPSCTGNLSELWTQNQECAEFRKNGGMKMVTKRPISNIEVRCNACNTLIGIINEDGVFEGNFDSGDTFSRMHIYDVVDDGKPLSDYQFEIDLCGKCNIAFDKIIKKFKLNKSKIPHNLQRSEKTGEST